MASIEIIIGTTARLALVLEDGDDAQFPRANVYQPGTPTPLAILSLTHLVEGMYESSWLPPALGTYNVVYTVYTDPGHTTPSDKYSKELDQIIVLEDIGQQISDLSILVTEIKMDVETILALQNENSFIDNTVYDNCCQIISSRIRVFDTKGHCEAATDGGSETVGLVATYQIVADYEAPAKMKTYRRVKL